MENFNVIRCGTENKGGQGICRASIDEFKKRVEDEEILKIILIDHFLYTWTNRRKGRRNLVSSKIDRVS